MSSAVFKVRMLTWLKKKMIKIDKIDTDALINLKKSSVHVQAAIHVWFYRLGAHLFRSAFKEIKRVPRHGQKYRVKHPLGGLVINHTASVPGETAANLFGGYARGLGYKVVGGNQMLFGDTAPYAAWLELGTGSKAVSSVHTNRQRILGSFGSGGGITPTLKGKTGMAARPGLAISIAANERNAFRDAVTEVKVRLERA